jgi:hypothetical protein
MSCTGVAYQWDVLVYQLPFTLLLREPLVLVTFLIVYPLLLQKLNAARRGGGSDYYGGVEIGDDSWYKYTTTEMVSGVSIGIHVLRSHGVG